MSAGKSINRREILKGFTLGLTAGAFSPNSIPSLAAAVDGFVADANSGLYTKKAPNATVSLVKGNERREIVYQSLKRIEDQIIPAIGNKKILVKPNFVSTKKQLAATHVDAIKAILDFLKPHAKNEIIVGESTAQRVSTFEGYKNYGYMGLEKEYGVKLIDLNKMPFVYRYVFGKENQPIPIRVISTFLDPELFIISAACLKTHDRVGRMADITPAISAASLGSSPKNPGMAIGIGAIVP